jgi:hypothetical protein
MLFLDRDGNGTVSNAGEFNFVGDAEGAQTDLEGLRAFDSNSDGILSSLDARFAEFRVWQDRDGDGAAEDGEILTLTQAGVRSLNLTGTAVEGSVNFGEVAVLNKGSYTRTNGTTMEFLDAAFTYFSSATSLPQIAVQQLSFERKADKYLIAFAGGEMTLNPRKAKGDLDSRAGALTASAMLSFKGKSFGMLSPIILDLDGDGVEMLSIKKARAGFDMNGDGVADDTGWAGKGDGFLVIDRNTDGKITDASELSFAAEDKDARSDLEALGALDNNGDGVLNKDDVRFAELKVWVDANGNGVSEEGELKTLAELGITEIGLRAQNREGFAKVGENVLLSTATFKRENGSTGTLGNVALAYRPGQGAAAGNGGGVSDGTTDNPGGNDAWLSTLPVIPDEISINPPFDPNQLLPTPLPTDPAPDAVVSGASVEAGPETSVDALVALLGSSTRSQSLSGQISTFGQEIPFNVDPFDYYDSSSTSFATAALQSIEADNALTSSVEGNSMAAGIAKAKEADPLATSIAQPDADRLLALIRQDMAVFGTQPSDNANPALRSSMDKPIDYFA